MPQAQSLDLHATLTLATSHFNEGRFTEALAVSSKVLEEDTANVAALHISGLSKLSLGHAEDALRLLEAAATKKKSDGIIANSLAQARVALGRVDDAASGLEKLARKNKLTAAGLNTLGDCRLRQEMPEKALACFEKALKIDNSLGAARVNIGEALKQAGDLDGAIHHYQTVTATHPALLSAWRNLGLALQSADQIEDSIGPLKYYVTRNSSDLATQLSLGSSYFKIGRFEDALIQFDQVLTKSSENAEAWNNRGLALRMLEREGEAETAFQSAITKDNTLDSAYYNLAHMLHETKGRAAALEVLDTAVRVAENKPKAHVRRSDTLLSDGLISEGWEDYQWRFQTPPEFAGRRDHKFPVWDGSDLAGKTILIWGEQGVGDEILYASMGNEIIAAAGSVILECDHRLVPLFERSFTSAIIRPRTNPPDEKLSQLAAEWQTPIGGLCKFLRPDLGSFGRGDAYLSSDALQKKEFAKQYKSNSSSKPVIGIAWRSGRDSGGREKSIPLEQWRPILNQEATFVSLQYGTHQQEIESIRNNLGIDIVSDPNVDSLKNLDTFASQVSAMDLVISNSNTAAHMAGALGVPTWTIVPRRGSGSHLWYWFIEGATCPWYNSMTLYRQTNWQDWSNVIENVGQDLKKFIATQ